MNQQLLGHSVENRPLEIVRLTQGPVPLWLMAGVHGDEWEGYYLIERFVREELWRGLEGKAALWVMKRMNPDGCEKRTRGNARGVDLNRNMPTKDWTPEAKTPRYNPGPQPGSEPETIALMKGIELIKPRVIISAHSWKPMINYNGPCKKLAERMAALNKYIVSDDIGYPTPGSLGTWSGWERKIPTITLEIEEDSPEEKIWATHAEALREALLFAATEKDLG
ncbi:MAG: succinylglutamate desuccinylase/aspartoacylase family protein [Bdellovibrionales bacterium]|nr:succinylglutamate desuccinylase/aspartoacylase family protein [Bdellovibrionales bacterium]